MTDVKITHIEAEPSDSAVDPLQIVITPGNDPQIGERVFGFKDGAGNPHKCLNKSAHAPVKSINVSDFSTAGLVRTDASGDLYGDVNTLGELNTALGGTTIDESTDPRDPNAHAIAGSDHTSSTLAELNSKISDATIDDSGDPRMPTQHAIGSATYHSASTLAQLNALVSDATLDDSSDSRTPTVHAASHESGGSDQLEHNKFYDLNTYPYDHIAKFSTFAALTGTAGTNGQIAELLGYYATGDGGEGFFTFDSSVGPGDVNGITIVSGGAGGCWVRKTETRGVINAAWAGAKGDGVTDDYTALQNCLDVLNGEGTLIIPAGSYYIGTGLTVPQSILNGLKIQGVGCVRWQNTGNPVTVIQTDQAINMMTFGTDGAHSLGGPIIQDIAFRDTSGTGAVPRAIYGINTSYARFINLSFGSFTGGTCIDVNGASSTTINCEIWGCYGRNVLNGVKLTNANSTKMFGGYFSGGGLGGKGIEVTGGGDSIMVSQLSVDSFADGVHCNSSTGAVMLANCRFEANDYSIRVSSGGTHILANPFIRNAAGQTGIRIEATAGTVMIISPGFLDSVGTTISDSGLYTTYYGGNRTPDKKVFWSLENTATPTVINGNIYKTGSTRTISPITNFSNGKEGQAITLFCDADVTLQNNANLYLHGAIDFAMSVDDTITLLKVGTVWKEMSRSINNTGPTNHAPVTVSDTAEIDMSISGQQISATLVAGSIDETKLDASVNASLSLADSAVQRSTVRSTSATTEIVTSDENNTVRITNARTSDIAITINASVLAIEGFRFTISVDYESSYIAYIGGTPPDGPGWSMNGNALTGYAQKFEFEIINGNPIPTFAPTAYYTPA